MCKKSEMYISKINNFLLPLDYKIVLEFYVFIFFLYSWNFKY